MMTPIRPTTRRFNPSAGGFSLLEVLVSLGIFTVGLVAVSAVFPTAITIQRETVRELDGRRVAQNAKTTLLAIARSNTEEADDDMPWSELSYNDPPLPSTAATTGSLKNYVSRDPAIRSTVNNPNPVIAMITLPGLPTPAGVSFDRLFTLDIRSYPQNFNALDTTTGANVSALRRDYYWYPLIQAKNISPGPPKWFAYLMVMHRSGSQAPPQIRRSGNITVLGPKITFANGLLGNLSNDEDNDGLPDYIQPGDRILADDGRVHRVILATADSVTVDSPSVGSPGSIYFAVAIDSTGNIKTETRSPIVWIEESIPLSINK
jgi:type II secretory pathway pseudopilin PulG